MTKLLLISCKFCTTKCMAAYFSHQFCHKKRF